MPPEVRFSPIKINSPASFEPDLNALQAGVAPIDVLAGVSHELWTPLTAILGLVSLLNETSLDAEQAELCQSIRVSGETMLNLINDVLDLYSLQSGKAQTLHESFDLQTCVEEAFTLVAPMALKKNLDMGCFIDPAAPVRVCGDPTRLRQVLVNLLSNAVKFTTHGTVALWVIADQTSPDEVWVDFTVQDSGRGIPADQIERLFEPFSRLPGENTTGSGLGLAISKALVEEMRGSITVESRPKHGSTFRVRLPLGYPDEPAAPPDRLSGRVLLIEPAPAVAKLLNRQMQAWGLKTTVVSSPREAAGLLAEKGFDTVLLSNRCLSASEDIQSVRSMLAQPACQPCRLLLLAPPGQTAQLLDRTGRSGVRVVYRPVRPSALRAALQDAPPPKTGTIAARRAAHRTDTPQTVDLRPLRVLVVEDDPVNHKVARLLLEKLGCPADSATHGNQALAACRARRYDALLLDVELPDTDGLTLARQLGDVLPAGERPYCIAVTAHASPGDRQRFIDGGMDDYLTKPVVKTELAAALARALPAKPIDRSRLIQYFQTASNDWRAVLSEVSLTYIETAGEWMAALHQAGRKADWPAVFRAAHSLRSASAQMAAIRLSRLARRLEQDAENLAAGSTWPAAAAPFEEQLSVLAAEFEAVLADLPDIGQAAG